MSFRDHDKQTLSRLIREFQIDPAKAREELKDDPDTIRILELMECKHDPQEDDSTLKPIIDAAHVTANQLVPGPRELGRCHKVWFEQKRLLLEQGIDWKTPAEMNPHSFFD